MNTVIFKNQLWKEGREYFSAINRDFIVDNHNRDFLHFISLYFTKNPDFEKYGELRKGLLIYGNSGSGKSSIFDIIQNVSKKCNYKNAWFKNISVHQVISNFNMDGEYVVKKHIRGNIYFDDLGAERIANNWGVKENLMCRILELRYNGYKEKGVKTYISTNLSMTELKKKYGERVCDRFFEMFNFIELKTEDTRRF